MIKILKRGFFLAKNFGVMYAMKKGINFLVAKTIKSLNSLFFKNNSKNHWDFRFLTDWAFVGGSNQTLYFACGLFANIDRKEIENVRTILDFGCGTGDSSIVFNIFLPKAKVFLHDFSQVAVKEGLKKYKRFLNVEAANLENKENFDLVYSSNVIEHVLKPELFVRDLIKISKKYVIIQCPWKEYHPDGKNITPENPVSEHFWTIDEGFLEKYVFANKEFEWTYKVGVVPMAWQGGEQVFIFGKLK